MPTSFTGLDLAVWSSFSGPAIVLALLAFAYRAHSRRANFGTAVVYPDLVWKKSSRSAQGNCVEVATIPGVILVRDSKNPIDGAALHFAEASWMEFIGSVKSGEMEPARAQH
jgi:hypothetical protein